MYTFPDLEPIHCSMSSSNCCFLTCIQTSQEVGKLVWYSHLFQNFPQCAVIHTVKGFGVVKKTEMYVLLELSCFFDDPMDDLWFLAFSKSSLNIWKFMVHILLEPGLYQASTIKYQIYFNYTSIKKKQLMIRKSIETDLEIG